MPNPGEVRVLPARVNRLGLVTSRDLVQHVENPMIPAGSSPATGLVIVPTYNEAPNIADVVERILERCRDFSILIVDDASPDGTGRIADRLAAEHRTVTVMHRPGKAGLGRAYVAAFRYALRNGYEWVVQLDADLSHRPEEIPRLVEKLNDHDAAIGSRFLPQSSVTDWNLARYVLSRSANRLIRRLTGLPLTDSTGGFKALRRSLLEAIELDSIQSHGYAIQFEVNYKAYLHNLRLCELPITFVGRKAGVSKLTLRNIGEGLGLFRRLLAERPRP